MKVVVIVLTLLIAAGLIHFVSDGHVEHIARNLPFCSGEPVDFYDFAGAFLIAFLIVRLVRLYRGVPETESETDDEPEFEGEEEEDV